MKVAIAGGHGQVAQKLARLLRDRGDLPLALIRDPDQAADVEAAGAEPVVVDLESADGQQIDTAISGADAVVFAAGAGPDSGPERKESVDYGAAVKLIEACRRTGVTRYVMLSSVGADAEQQGDEAFDVYLRAKGRADRELAESGLNFTIVRPVRLTDGAGTGRIATGQESIGEEIPREDVAATISEVLRSDGLIGVTFAFSSGDTGIDEALGQVA
jgi:cytosine deaminase